MRHVVCGMGEVGTALWNVIAESNQDVYSHDPPKLGDPCTGSLLGCDVLHICYGWCNGFIETVKEYQGQFRPEVTIIHSTVPVGTTRMVGGRIAHSPVHGVHPNLEQGLKTFDKLVAGVCERSTQFASISLASCKMFPVIYSSPESTELSKILCTTQYAWNVVLCKEIAKECEKLGVPFEEVYSQWNQEYNRGYRELGKENVTRPNLTPMPGPIGGHCLIPNAKLHDCWLTETILKRNEDYKDE